MGPCCTNKRISNPVKYLLFESMHKRNKEQGKYLGNLVDSSELSTQFPE